MQLIKIGEFMTSIYLNKFKDLGVVFVPPLSPLDVRVPTAEELSLEGQIRALSLSKPRHPWDISPQFTYDSSRQSMNLKVIYKSFYNQALLIINQDFRLKELLLTEKELKESLYLASFLVEEGVIHDQALGNVIFQYEDNGIVNNSPAKENTRRLREKLGLLMVRKEQTINNFPNALLTDGYYSINVPISVGALGYNVGTNFIFYPLGEWVRGVDYRLPLEMQSINTWLLTNFVRYQDSTLYGYRWLPEWESNYFSLSVNSHNQWRTGSSTKEFAYQLMSGEMFGNDRYPMLIVRNLNVGSTPSGYRHPGVPLISPNNSFAIANDQRISFTGEERVHQYATQRLVAQNDNGVTVVTATLNTNSPNGTYFSPNPLDHKIYSLDGKEQSKFGRFVGLGSQNSLSWIGGNRCTINPFDEVIFVPGIVYPPNSGFDYPLEKVIEVRANDYVIDNNDILDGTIADLTAYREPKTTLAPFIVVYGIERNALHYILKKVTVVSDDNGLLEIPIGEKGCFAFIKNREGRLDVPIVTGLTKNTSYDCLVYYPPRNDELWQFIYQTVPYQGKKFNPSDLLGKTITIEENPILFVHSQGGANSVSTSDRLLRYKPISFYLPHLNKADFSRLDAPVVFFGEGQDILINLREKNIDAGKDSILPKRGMNIRLEEDEEVFYPFSISGKMVEDESGFPVGYLSPVPASDYSYQYCLFCSIRIDNQLALMVSTTIINKQSEIFLDSAMGTAIDIFEVGV